MSDPSPALRAELDRMRARQDALEAENSRLKDQIGSLRDEVAGAPPTTAAVSAPARDATGFNRGGAGFFSRGDDYNFRVLGYVQAVGSVFDSRVDRTDGNGDFSIRRARLDFLADFFDDYQIFIEIDGGPTSSAPGASDFALVEARLNWKIMDEALQLRVGKFTSPFSAENFRSSRAIDTIERFMALNSLFGLPAFDTQTGAMLHGTLGSDERLGYYLAFFNGNGRANDNFSDSNDRKEITTKLTYATSGLSAGLAFDYSQEEPQTLSLSDLAFNSYLSLPVEGRRVGIDADLFWERDRLSLRAEGVAFRFDSPTQDEVHLFGGFVQPAMFLWGDGSRGLQLLLRAELARVDADTGSDGDTLYAATLGANWYVNPNVRVQINGILQYFDGSSAQLDLDDRELIPLLLTEIQFKF